MKSGGIEASWRFRLSCHGIQFLLRGLGVETDGLGKQPLYFFEFALTKALFTLLFAFEFFHFLAVFLDQMRDFVHGAPCPAEPGLTGNVKK